MHQHGDGELLTAREVAILLRVTTQWVYNATRHGDVPHVRLGRYVRYRRDAIEAWLTASESAGAARRPL
jgi:excisionase family DNA binding protein